MSTIHPCYSSQLDHWLTPPWCQYASNATTSPLLRLPAEIRDKIWTEVLGGRLTYLDYHYGAATMDFDYYDDFYERFHGYSPWKHVACEDDGLEDRGKEVMVPNPKYFEAAPGAKEYWVYPHAACQLEFNPAGASEPIEYDLYKSIGLTILLVSYKTYTEANNTLWTTNAFSFPNGLTFRRFMMISEI